MSKKIRARIKNGKLKIHDEQGKLIDVVRPFDLEDTIKTLQLKYGEKKLK